MAESHPFPTEFVRGALELLVLGALQDGALHGYALIQELRTRSDSRLRMNEGAVYPLLHRLERGKLLRSASDASSGRPRKSYALTAAGKRALKKAHDEFAEFARFALQVSEPEPKP